MKAKTGNAQFSVTVSVGTKVFHYKLVSYPSGRASFPTESNETWATKEEAEAVCARVNAGDETGVTFASYADD
jgi:hypothetical protein